MKRIWQIMVLLVAVVFLLLPAAGYCFASPQIHQDGHHSCCADETAMQAPSCCRHDAAPHAELPQPTRILSAGTLAMSPLHVAGINASVPAMSLRMRRASVAILLPATVLRT